MLQYLITTKAMLQ